MQMKIAPMANSPLVLIVEDQIRERDALSRVLRAEGYQTICAVNIQESLECLDGAIDFMICDVCLGRENGLDVLRECKQRHPDVPVVMVTAYGAISNAVAAMKIGAVDYLTKPLNPEELLMLLGRHLRGQHGRDATRKLGTSNLATLLGTSKVMQSIYDQINDLAHKDIPVLITGESGTGKELIASAIHEQSYRSGHPYVAVNIGALPEALVEAELFGYAPGSFIKGGAGQSGRFMAANRGTLFLDGVEQFPLAAQAKIVHALKQQSFIPVGAENVSHADVRVIAASSRDLWNLVREDLFREDLLRQFNFRELRLPALRERPEDIPHLVDHFLTDCARRLYREAPSIHPDLARLLRSYQWPGNIRQLRNAIENMLVASKRDVLTIENLTEFLSGKPVAHARHG